MVEIYQRTDGKWDWRLIAANGNTLCNSDQGYENKGDALQMATNVVSGSYSTATFAIVPVP